MEAESSGGRVVFLVILEMEYSPALLDSIWSSREAALARVEELKPDEEFYFLEPGHWKAKIMFMDRPGDLGEVPWEDVDIE